MALSQNLTDQDKPLKTLNYAPVFKVDLSKENFVVSYRDELDNFLSVNGYELDGSSDEEPSENEPTRSIFDSNLSANPFALNLDPSDNRVSQEGPIPEEADSSDEETGGNPNVSFPNVLHSMIDRLEKTGRLDVGPQYDQKKSGRNAEAFYDLDDDFINDDLSANCSQETNLQTDSSKLKYDGFFVFSGDFNELKLPDSKKHESPLLSQKETSKPKTPTKKMSKTTSNNRNESHSQSSIFSNKASLTPFTTSIFDKKVEQQSQPEIRRTRSRSKSPCRSALTSQSDILTNGIGSSQKTLSSVSPMKGKVSTKRKKNQSYSQAFGEEFENSLESLEKVVKENKVTSLPDLLKTIYKKPLERIAILFERKSEYTKEAEMRALSQVKETIGVRDSVSKILKMIQFVNHQSCASKSYKSSRQALGRLKAQFLGRFKDIKENEPSDIKWEREDLDGIENVMKLSQQAHLDYKDFASQFENYEHFKGIVPGSKSTGKSSVNGNGKRSTGSKLDLGKFSEVEDNIFAEISKVLPEGLGLTKDRYLKLDKQTPQTFKPTFSSQFDEKVFNEGDFTVREKAKKSSKAKHQIVVEALVNS